MRRSFGARLPLTSAWALVSAWLMGIPFGFAADVTAQLPGGEGDRFAVIVGIDRYSDPGITPLRFAAADATAFHKLLTDPAGGAFLPGSARLLTDAGGPDDQPTRANILAALKIAAANAQENDTLLFYFGGHGIEDCLLPCDARLAALEDTGVSVSRVNEIIEASRARRVVVIYDCCHSGGARQGAKATEGMAGALEDAFFRQADGRVTLASCSRDEVAYEWPERGHGVFTACLLQGLQGAADGNNDGAVTATEVAEYVQRQVKLWAVAARKVQTPRLRADVSGPILLAVSRPATPVAVTTKPAAPDSTLPRQPAAGPAVAAGVAGAEVLSAFGHRGPEHRPGATPATLGWSPTDDRPCADKFVVHAADGSELVWVPAGEFLMGQAQGEGGARPVHKVRLSRGYWIGRVEVTNAQYRRFCDETKRNFPAASDQDDNHPVVNVTWEEAQAYCTQYGLRLPTEAEWEYAARGADGRTFPWGPAWDPGLCPNNDNRGPGGRTFPVASFPQGASPCGALDMAGNVWEWCSDWYGPYPSDEQSEPQGPATGLQRTLRGGSWDAAGATYFMSATRNRLEPKACLVVGGGFRVCVSADEPLPRGTYVPIR